ncbi:MAG: hypothetical protein WAQ28_13445 [Bacteroidia bacterium]
MKRFILPALLLFITVLIQNEAVAQVVSSPYSRYGIGEIGGKGFGQNFAMGGTSIALHNDTTPYFINPNNPASYSNIGWTSAELGANIGITQLQSSSIKQTVSSASLGYLSLGIPLKKWWGASVGLIPYSSVGYKVSDNQSIANVGDVNFIYEGSGGVNQLYLGNGIKPLYGLKNKALSSLSLGFNASYMFGNIDNVKRSIFPSTTKYFNTRAATTTRVGDIYFDYGVQYSYTVDSMKGKALKEKFKILFGATFANETALTAKVDSLAYTYLNSSNYEIVKDTIQNIEGVKGSLKMPLSFGIGLGVKRGERLLIAGDFRIQNWSSYRFFNNSQNLKNSITASLGAQYAPFQEGSTKGKYLKSINYRAGIRYSETPIELKNTRLKEYSLSFGFSLPVDYSMDYKRYMSRLNIGVEIGQRGTTVNGLIKEQFIRGTVSFSINDRWFRKVQYN